MDTSDDAIRAQLGAADAAGHGDRRAGRLDAPGNGVHATCARVAHGAFLSASGGLQSGLRAKTATATMLRANVAAGVERIRQRGSPESAFVRL